jgi:hypothetical protein
VLGGGGVLLVVEVVEQAGYAPELLVLAEFAGVGAQAGLDRRRRFSEGVYSHSKRQAASRLIAAFSWFSPIFFPLSWMLPGVLPKDFRELY